MQSKSNSAHSLILESEYEFFASHALFGFETPHVHLWKITACFEANLPLKSDRLIDLVYLQAVFEKIVSPIRNTFLNDTLSLSPTSENLALFFWEKLKTELPAEPLQEVRVRLCNLDGHSIGSARVVARPVASGDS